MKWLEIIELRTSGYHRKFLDPELKKLIDELNKETGEGKLKIFSRNAVDGDYCILLFHDFIKADLDGSSLGLRLVSNLKSYGLINHSIWEEKFVN